MGWVWNPFTGNLDFAGPGSGGTTTTSPGAATPISYTQNFPLQQASPIFIGTIASTGTTAASAAANPFGSSLSLQRLFLPGPMALSEVDLAFGIGFPATNQGQGSLSQSFVAYSFGNSTSLASVASASRSISWASGTTTSGTSSSLQQGWSGPNIQPFTFASSSLSPGEYAFAHLFSWAAESTSWFVSVYGANALGSQTQSAVTNLTSASLAAASSFTTASSALTAWTATPTSAGLMGSAGLAAVSAFTATTGAAITAFAGAPATAPVFLTATGTSVALIGASALTASGSAAITAFSGAPATAPVFVTATGTSVALLDASALTALNSAALTVFTSVPFPAVALGGSFGTSGVTVTVNGWSSLVTTGLTAWSAVGLHSTTAITGLGLVAGSFHTATTSQALTMWTAAPSAMNFSGVGSTAAFSTTNVSTFTAGSLVIKATATAASVASLLLNTGTAAFAGLSTAGLAAGSYVTSSATAGVADAIGITAHTLLNPTSGTIIVTALSQVSLPNVMSNARTGGVSLLSTNGFLAGSFFTASGIANAYTGGTGASSFLSTNGLLGGSFLTASGSVGAYTGGTGASGFLSSAGLSAGSFIGTSGSVAGLANVGTAGASLAGSFATASFGALTNAAVATGSLTAATTTLPSLGYNGAGPMTTNTSQAVYPWGKFSAGIMLTGNSPSSIDLRSTAMLITGSVALEQPWFALCGS